MNETPKNLKRAQKVFDFLAENRDDAETQGWYGGYDISRNTGLSARKMYPALTYLLKDKGVLADGWFRSQPDGSLDLTEQFTHDQVCESNIENVQRLYKALGQITLI